MSDLIRRRLITAGLILPFAGTAATALAAAQKAAPRPAPPNVHPAALPEDMVLGSPAAKVTVVEYASVGCPICAEWGKTVWPAFKAKYIDSGKVRFVYREMLVGADMEVTAAAAGYLLARCAGPDKYFSVVEAEYRDQEAVFKNPRTALMAIAKGAGLNEAQFTACLDKDASYDALYKRVALNSKTGDVHATPTFVINGKKLEPGFQPLAVLDAAIAKA
jgi:protein-disulfide isomerase